MWDLSWFFILLTCNFMSHCKLEILWNNFVYNYNLFNNLFILCWALCFKSRGRNGEQVKLYRVGESNLFTLELFCSFSCWALSLSPPDAFILSLSFRLMAIPMALYRCWEYITIQLDMWIKVETRYALLLESNGNQN